MSRFPAALVVVPLQQRKLVDPAKREHIRIGKTEPLAEIVTNRRKRFRNDTGHVGDRENEVPGLCPDVRCHCGELRCAQELGDGRANAVGLDREGGKSLRAGPRRDLGELVDLTPGVPGTVRDNDRLDLTARRKRLGERAEFGLSKRVGDVVQLESEAQIGAVTPKPIHGFFVGQAWKRGLQDALFGESLGQARRRALR